MNRMIALTGVLSLGLALGGCAGEIGQWIQKETGLTPAQQNGIAVAAPCLIALVTAEANGIAIDSKASQGAQAGFGIATNVTADACKASGGIIQAVKSAAGQ